MLHIVQVILSGAAEAPRLFADQAQAEAAYVEAAKKYWQQSYAGYCEKAGVAGDSFAAAQAFVAGFDLAERSRLHFWTLAPEDAGAGADEGMSEEQRQQLVRLVAGMERASGAVRDGLAELRAMVAGESTPVAEERSPSLPPGVAAMPFAEPFPTSFPGMDAAEPPLTSPTAPKPAGALPDDQEWRAYVDSIMHMCGGNRSEFKLFQRSDWRQAVYSDETTLEYWDWVATQIDTHIEKAQAAGYSVIDDPEQPGRYRFRTPAGDLGEVAVKAKGEAWCRAGLHLVGR